MILRDSFLDKYLLVSVLFVLAINTTVYSEDRLLTVSISGEMLKHEGAVLPAASKGKLIAQLFDSPGGGEPIWSDIIYDEIKFPENNSQAVILVLGNKTELINPATGNPIKLEDPKCLLLTLQVEGKTYASPRMVLNVVRYAHQATEAFEAARNSGLRKTLVDHENRIKKLEETLAAREAELESLMKGFRKLRKEVNGTALNVPVDR